VGWVKTRFDFNTARRVQRSPHALGNAVASMPWTMLSTKPSPEPQQY
jgi:hypothetical protein